MGAEGNRIHSIPSAALGNAERSPRSASPSVHRVQCATTAGAGTVEILTARSGSTVPTFLLAQEEKTHMRISAEICFTDPCDPDGAVAALRGRGYHIDKIEDLRDDVQVQAVFVHAARDVTDAELGTSGDRWAAGGLVLDESNEIVEPFGGCADNAG
jgi:hypothetical protein